VIRFYNMMLEYRNSQLLENGSLKRVSATMDTLVEVKYEIDARFIATDRHQNNKRIIRVGDLYSPCSEIIKLGHVIDWRSQIIRDLVVRDLRRQFSVQCSAVECSPADNGS
jgi:hypothetical protein